MFAFWFQLLTFSGLETVFGNDTKLDHSGTHISVI